jgi:hypothetical protein
MEGQQGVVTRFVSVIQRLMRFACATGSRITSGMTRNWGAPDVP